MTTLIDQLKTDIERTLGRKGEKLLQSVDVYGGEFTAKELLQHKTAAPACLIACLGWPLEREKTINRIPPPSRDVRMAFFVLTKNANRSERMTSAIAICERLTEFLIDWEAPDDLSGCVGSFKDIVAENLYGRATDANGVGLWLVRASITVGRCKRDGMKDFMATLIAPTIIIDSNAITQSPEPAAPPASATLQQNINLNQQDIGADDGNQN